MAHYDFKISTPALLLGLFCLLAASLQPACAQSYRGASRCLRDAGGLATQPGSYITGGTLSHSAQVGAGLMPGSSTSGISGAGITPGISGNSNLPTVRLGSTVGTAGDYMRSDLNPTFSYQQQPRQSQAQYYNNQRRYYQAAQQASPYSGTATYGQPYARNSMPTGRQAYQAPTVSRNTATGSSNYGSSGGQGSNNSGATGEYRGY